MLISDVFPKRNDLSWNGYNAESLFHPLALLLCYPVMLSLLEMFYLFIITITFYVSELPQIH